MQSPCVLSVIIPAYNSERYLERCLASLTEKQTFKEPYEIIIELDPSKDQTLAIAQSFQKRYPFITIDAPAVRMGIGKSRLVGITRARGTYFYFVDADDWVAPNALERLVGAIRESDADCVNCSFYYVRGKGSIHLFPWHKNALLSREEALKAFFGDSYLRGFCWSKIYKTEIAKKRPLMVLAAPLDMQYEDVALNCALLSYCQKIRVISDPLYFYDRTNNQSAMSVKRTNRAFRHCVVFALERLFLERQHDEKGLKVFAHELPRSWLSLVFDVFVDARNGANHAYRKSVWAAFKIVKNMKKPLVAEGSFFEVDAQHVFYFGE